MNDPQPVPPRRRLQELLAIPDGQRTDEQWDELNELEIMLASGNRERPQQGQGAQAPANPVAGQQPRPGGPNNAKRPGKKFRHRSHKRPPTP